MLNNAIKQKLTTCYHNGYPFIFFPVPVHKLLSYERFCIPVSFFTRVLVIIRLFIFPDFSIYKYVHVYQEIYTQDYLEHCIITTTFYRNNECRFYPLPIRIILINKKNLSLRSHFHNTYVLTGTAILYWI